MKLCTKCRHFDASALDKFFHKCAHPSHHAIERTSLVTGEPETKSVYCDLEREFGKCGPEGRLWGAK
jgi:hypothetical protein